MIRTKNLILLYMLRCIKFVLCRQFVGFSLLLFSVSNIKLLMFNQVIDQNQCLVFIFWMKLICYWSQSSTYHCCHSPRRRWVPLASYHDFAPWSPSRSCRWGLALPPAGRGTKQKGKGDTGEGRESGDCQSTWQLNCTNENNKVALCVLPQWLNVAVWINKPWIEWKLQWHHTACGSGNRGFRIMKSMRASAMSELA